MAFSAFMDYNVLLLQKYNSICMTKSYPSLKNRADAIALWNWLYWKGLNGWDWLDWLRWLEWLEWLELVKMVEHFVVVEFFATITMV